jgi:hypothetical protein
MKLFELYISYISWGSDGKWRPVLVFALKDEQAFVYVVTSQYESKSQEMRTKYFKINDWDYAGLDKQSYIDTKNYFSLPISMLKNKVPIGQLSAKDKQNLLEYLTK